MQLRDYQVRAIDRVSESFADGNKRVMLYSPTGSGKTRMAIELIRRARENHQRCQFVVNRIGLVDQAARRLMDAGIHPGLIQGANTRATYLPVLCCSIQTLARRGRPDAEFIIIDEAHGTAAAKAYHNMLESCNGSRVVGLSATPFVRGLGKYRPQLNGPLWQDLVVAASIRELISAEHLVDCEIFAPSKPDLSCVKIVAGDYQEDQLGEAMDKQALIGDIVEHWRKLGGDKRTVCFATNIAHSQHIVAKFWSYGIRAEHIDCYTTDDDRREILRRLETGETKIVSNVAVLAEGWDCPAVEIMILARPTRSLSRYIQMAGRVLRPAPGKHLARILDHSDTCLRLGFPTDDLPLELDDGRPRKSGSSSEKEKEKLPHECSKCHYLKPAGIIVCPSCGHVPVRKDTVQVKAGELRQIKHARVPRMEKQDVYSQLLGYAASKGLKQGWASHKYRACFGVWPRGLREVETEASLPVRSWARACYQAWKEQRPEPAPEFI